MSGQVHILFGRRAFTIPATMAFLLFDGLQYFAAILAFTPGLADRTTLGAAGLTTNGFNNVQFTAGLTKEITKAMGTLQAR